MWKPQLSTPQYLSTHTCQVLDLKIREIFRRPPQAVPPPQPSSSIPYILRQVYKKAKITTWCRMLKTFTIYNIACLYILFSFHTFFSFHIAFLLQFFFSFHITFLYSFSELLYKFVADFAFFNIVLEGVYLWAGPEWFTEWFTWE